MPSLGELFGMLKGYARDALPGGALNPETRPISDMVTYASGALDPQSKISRDAQAWHQKTQRGLKDQLAGKQTPEAEYAYNQLMNMVGVAPLGMTAWHGSPHKFDKFSLDKIGTGEGAQAYGHGLYLAEAKDVADQYAGKLSRPIVQTAKGFSVENSSGLSEAARNVLADMQAKAEIAQYQHRGSLASEVLNRASAEVRKELVGDAPPWKALDVFDTGSLYKTDIPDEAVSRFLDWDKPLSQQAPEVQKALQNIKLPMIDGQVLGKTGYTTAVPLDKALGQNAYDALAWRERAQGASDQLKAAGIPGIRYLDGGSRGTGTGTSNFVVFDPEMIRILERNGQPTGQQPWALGEWLQQMK